MFSLKRRMTKLKSLSHLISNLQQFNISSSSELIAKMSSFTNNQKLIKFVLDKANLCKPDQVVFCNGSDEEYLDLCKQMVLQGQLKELVRPNSYLARSDPLDVARVESKTFICSKNKEDCGPTNNWVDPGIMKENLTGLFNGCMKGRTMYVVPFSMGPIDSDISKMGVEITDSPYVVCNMKIMTRVSPNVYQKLGENGFFVECLHSVGKPILSQKDNILWPCNPEKTASNYYFNNSRPFP